MGGRRLTQAHRIEYDRLRDLLTEARLSKHLSQRELSHLLGRSTTFVNKLESGERHIDLVELIDIARVLDLDAVTLVQSVLLPDEPTAG